MEELQLHWQVPMMMNKYTMCCERCFQTIAQHDTVAAKIWMDFCFYVAENGQILKLKHVDFPELRSLENFGFLVSTDHEDAILVQLKGNLKTNSGDLWFCINGDVHAK